MLKLGLCKLYFPENFACKFPRIAGFSKKLDIRRRREKLFYPIGLLFLLVKHLHEHFVPGSIFFRYFAPLSAQRYLEQPGLPALSFQALII